MNDNVSLTTKYSLRFQYLDTILDAQLPKIDTFYVHIFMVGRFQNYSHKDS
jgi:hypothetical protein